MRLIYSRLKELIPELNEKVVTPDRMLEVFAYHGIEFYEDDIKKCGLTITKSGIDFVILKRALNYLVMHKTICHEGTHALTMYPAKFLYWRHEIEAKTLSLICMFPAPDLPYLNKIKDQLEPDRYELLMQRNSSHKTWTL